MKIKVILAALSLAAAVTSCKSACECGGPRISVLGDSYSTYEGAIPEGNAIWYFAAPRNKNDVTKMTECWWSQVVTNLNGTLERNESWSGSTICNTGYGHKDVSLTSFIARTDRLGNPDIILVCGATNDSWAKAPIGEYKYADWTREDLFTFRPAMAKMLVDLGAKYPKAKVYFMLNSELSADINDSVHEICRHYDVPCIDLKDIDKQQGHPSIAGMRAIADQVTAAIRK